MYGGIEVDHKPHVWQDTIDNIVNNGELLKLAVDYLKRIYRPDGRKPWYKQESSKTGF